MSAACAAAEHRARVALIDRATEAESGGSPAPPRPSYGCAPSRRPPSNGRTPSLDWSERSALTLAVWRSARGRSGIPLSSASSTAPPTA